MFPKNEVVIFGAGRWGRTAHEYYKGLCNIIGFIDNDPELQGKILNGMEVFSPNILRSRNCTVIIAMKQHVDEVKRYLYEVYDIKECVVFRPHTSLEICETLSEEEGEELIVKFSSGLGNDLFQYAIYKVFARQGRNVRADLSEHLLAQNKKGTFILPDVFPDIHLNLCSSIMKHFGCNRYYQESPHLRYVYNDMNILSMTSGVLDGYFQTYKYAQMVENELRKELNFYPERDAKLLGMIDEIHKRNCISVHIRRGDYVKLASVYGELWNTDYYEKAMKYMRDRFSNPVFCFFSDDINWVKKNYREKNAIYITPDMFDLYEDWYDMCLMSHCKHNIIPNSTFGWWGAWLNPKIDKIVIAPKQWFPGVEIEDICPPEWNRM